MAEAVAVSAFSEQPLQDWRRAVLKVGSSLLAGGDDGLSPRHALGLAQFVSASLRAGREVVIVSSARSPPDARSFAINRRGRSDGRAAGAGGIGPGRLIGLWQRFFERPVAQVLLTHDDCATAAAISMRAPP